MPCLGPRPKFDVEYGNNKVRVNDDWRMKIVYLGYPGLRNMERVAMKIKDGKYQLLYLAVPDLPFEHWYKVLGDLDAEGWYGHEPKDEGEFWVSDKGDKEKNSPESDSRTDRFHFEPLLPPSARPHRWWQARRMSKNNVNVNVKALGGEYVSIGIGVRSAVRNQLLSFEAKRTLDELIDFDNAWRQSFPEYGNQVAKLGEAEFQTVQFIHEYVCSVLPFDPLRASLLKFLGISAKALQAKKSAPPTPGDKTLARHLKHAGGQTNAFRQFENGYAKTHAPPTPGDKTLKRHLKRANGPSFPKQNGPPRPGDKTLARHLKHAGGQPSVFQQFEQGHAASPSVEAQSRAPPRPGDRTLARHLKHAVSKPTAFERFEQQGFNKSNALEIKKKSRAPPQPGNKTLARHLKHAGGQTSAFEQFEKGYKAEEKHSNVRKIVDVTRAPPRPGNKTLARHLQHAGGQQTVFQQFEQGYAGTNASQGKQTKGPPRPGDKTLARHLKHAGGQPTAFQQFEQEVTRSKAPEVKQKPRAPPQPGNKTLARHLKHAGGQPTAFQQFERQGFTPSSNNAVVTRGQPKKIISNNNTVSRGPPRPGDKTLARHLKHAGGQPTAFQRFEEQGSSRSDQKDIVVRGPPRPGDKTLARHLQLAGGQPTAFQQFAQKTNQPNQPNKNVDNIASSGPPLPGDKTLARHLKHAGGQPTAFRRFEPPKPIEKLDQPPTLPKRPSQVNKGPPQPGDKTLARHIKLAGGQPTVFQQFGQREEQAPALPKRRSQQQPKAFPTQAEETSSLPEFKQKKSEPVQEEKPPQLPKFSPPEQENNGPPLPGDKTLARHIKLAGGQPTAFQQFKPTANKSVQEKSGDEDPPLPGDKTLARHIKLAGTQPTEFQQLQPTQEEEAPPTLPDYKQKKPEPVQEEKPPQLPKFSRPKQENNGPPLPGDKTLARHIKLAGGQPTAFQQFKPTANTAVQQSSVDHSSEQNGRFSDPPPYHDPPQPGEKTLARHINLAGAQPTVFQQFEQEGPQNKNTSPQAEEVTDQNKGPPLPGDKTLARHLKLAGSHPTAFEQFEREDETQVNDQPPVLPDFKQPGKGPPLPGDKTLARHLKLAGGQPTAFEQFQQAEEEEEETPPQLPVFNQQNKNSQSQEKTEQSKPKHQRLTTIGLKKWFEEQLPPEYKDKKPTNDNVLKREEPKPEESEWEEYVDDATGQPYWHNSKTGTSTWNNPFFSSQVQDSTNQRNTPNQESGEDTTSGTKTDGDVQNGTNQVATAEDSDWERYVDDESGKEFWFNSKTGKATWEKPEPEKEVEWKKYVDDESGRDFWYNAATGKATWIDPAA
eukprot:jgi/Bigna1/86656/estExt_fgenesh1_pg.C_120152